MPLRFKLQLVVMADDNDECIEDALVAEPARCLCRPAVSTAGIVLPPRHASPRRVAVESTVCTTRKARSACSTSGKSMRRLGAVGFPTPDAAQPPNPKF
jgi:hypothetical protein